MPDAFYEGGFPSLAILLFVLGLVLPLPYSADLAVRRDEPAPRGEWL